MDTAQLGILSTAIVGGLGIVVPALNASGDRKHQQRMARSSRLYAQRLELYNDAARAVGVLRAIANRPQPVIGPQPGPPAPMSDDELLELNARLAVGGSAAVLDAVRESSRALALFLGAVGVYEAARAAGVPWTDERKQMEEARDAVYDAIKDAERVMREELEKV